MENFEVIDVLEVKENIETALRRADRLIFVDSIRKGPTQLFPKSNHVSTFRGQPHRNLEPDDEVCRASAALMVREVAVVTNPFVECVKAVVDLHAFQSLKVINPLEANSSRPLDEGGEIDRGVEPAWFTHDVGVSRDQAPLVKDTHLALVVKQEWDCQGVR